MFCIYGKEKEKSIKGKYNIYIGYIIFCVNRDICVVEWFVGICIVSIYMVVMFVI